MIETSAEFGPSPLLPAYYHWWVAQQMRAMLIEHYLTYCSRGDEETGFLVPQLPKRSEDDLTSTPPPREPHLHVPQDEAGRTD